MISVVVVYNDLTQFERLLHWSLARQTVAHEVIALDNRDGRFGSAALALNHGARQARGDFIFFAHQDVRFDSPTWLADVETVLRGVDLLGIAGVSGARPSPDRAGREVVTNVTYDDPPRPAGVPLEAPLIVESVDECAFFVPRPVFERLSFDERTCDGWHLYAVDYSLAVKRLGLQAWAIPAPLYHRSPGAVFRILGFATFEAAYFRALERLARKYHDRPFLHTTCGRWATGRSMMIQRFPPRVVWRAWRVTLRRALGWRG